MQEMDARQLARLKEATGTPPQAAVTASRRQMLNQFAKTAPLIQWTVVPSPLGLLYIAASAQGVCRVDFGVSHAR